MDNLKRCIAEIMDDKTSSAAREAANQRLCTFQNDPNSIAVCIEGFFRPECVDPNVLSFLMNVAKTQVVMFHERWPTDIKEAFRLNLVRCYTLPLFAHHPRTSEKMAQILVEVVVREWPQMWPNAFDTVYEWLENRGDNDCSIRYLGMLFLSLFITSIRHEAGEDVLGGWSNERKAEITAAFNEVLPGFAQWIMNRYVLSSGSDNSSPTHLMAVKLYGQLCGWARLEQHEKYVNWCLDMINEDNHSPAVKEEAIEALSELSNRNLHPTSHGDSSLIDFLLGETGMKKFNTALESSIGRCYLSFRQLTDIVCDLLSKISSLDNPAHLKRIQSIILDVQFYLSHPSLYVRSALIMCVLDVLRHQQQADDFAREVIAQSMPLLIAILAENPQKTFKTAENQNDFDEYVDYLKVYEYLKARIGELVARLCKANPLVFIQLLESQSSKLLGSGSSGEWKMAILFLIQNGIVSNDAISDNADIIGPVQSIYSRVVQLLQLNQNDFKLIEEGLYACKSICLFIPSAKIYSECFSVFAHFATLKSDGALQVRCRSMACFYQMALNSPPLFLPLILQFLSIVSHMNGQRELRTWVETVIFMASQDESVIARSSRLELLKAVFDPLLAQINACTASRLADDNEFAKYIGLLWMAKESSDELAPTEVATELGATKTNRAELCNTLTLLQVALKGLKVGQESVDMAVREVVVNVLIPFILRVLRIMSSLQHRLSDQPSYPLIFCDEFSTEDDDEYERNEDSLKKNCRYLSNWYNHIRTVCYISLGYLANCPFDMAEMVSGFDHLKYSERTSLVRCALLPLLKTDMLGDELTARRVLIPMFNFCKEDLDRPLFYDSEHRQASEWLNTFTSFACDVVLKERVKWKNETHRELYCAAIMIQSICIAQGAPQAIISKWSSVIVLHIDVLMASHSTDAELMTLLFSRLPFHIIESLRRRSLLHTQLMGLLMELYKGNVEAGLYLIDQLIARQCNVSMHEIGSVRPIFAKAPPSRPFDRKRAMAAMRSLLQPVLAQAKPAGTASIKKLVPDKLIILSKLRRAAEQEEQENMAIRDAATLFD